MSLPVSKLRVNDEDFLVASMIDRCPKIMMMRELVQNALEATLQAPAGRRRVELFATDVDGTPKLSIRNTGPGLDAVELRSMCDIASSIRKVKGLDDNFGMGAKVASLPSNQHGMRYRSCKAGRVHEVLLGKRDGVYGRVLRALADGSDGDVIEVTEQLRAAGDGLDYDWTEVVLLGNAAEQNTLTDPYGGDPAVGPRWLVDDLYHRFYRLPEGVSVTLGPGTHPRKGTVEFRPLASRMAAGQFLRCEARTAESGIIVHYLHDPQHPTNPRYNASLGDGLYPDHSLGGVVFRNELYNLRKRWRWNVDAPNFGIPFATRHISVHVELPDDFPARADGYRQYLRYRAGAQDQVRMEDFEAEVVALRPDWLIQLIKEFTPDTGFVEDVRGMLQHLLQNLGVPRQALPQPAKASPGAAKAQPKTPADPAQAKPGGRLDWAPQVYLLRQPREVEDRGLNHRAARYYPDQHQLFVNLRYDAVDASTQLLERDLPDAEREAARIRARELSEQAMVQRVARALAFALAKRDRAEGWSPTEKKTVLSSETLTIAADDIYTGIAELKLALRERLAKPKPARAKAGRA